MWNYEKRLQYPINITQPNAKIAQVYHEPVRWPIERVIPYNNTKKNEVDTYLMGKGTHCTLTLFLFIFTLNRN